MDASQVLKKPIITEKSTRGTSLRRYTFKVARGARKKEIARVVEQLFNVHVQAIKTVTVRGKRKRTGRFRKESKQPDWKKATVELKEGEKVDIFETGE